MFGKAFKEVIDHECVADRDRVKFQTLYESVFQPCFEQQEEHLRTGRERHHDERTEGGFKEEGIDMFTIDELQKLRKATTEREKQAFLWFFGTFLECVSGLRHWGVAKV